MNLLKETLTVLAENGKSEKDIEWCGSEEYGWFSWEEFKKLADTEYDRGYGDQEIAIDLIIAGKDFWLAREEYDGDEWWGYRTMPIKSIIAKQPKALTQDQANKLYYTDAPLNLIGNVPLKVLNNEQTEDEFYREN